VDLIPYGHLLDHIYALAVSGLDGAERETFDTWLWSDPAREAKLLAMIGR
jgi:hypothetical protein